MQITNIQYHRNVPFDEYLSMPGVSFSSLKGEIPQSAGMALGSRVHNYLNEPATYDWVDSDAVRPIAAQLRAYLGDAYRFLEKEVAVTALFTHNGMQMVYKGRIDMLRVGRIVIDLKILSGSLESACMRFGYIDQVAGYCIGGTCDRGLIIAYNKKNKKVETKPVTAMQITNSFNNFWAYQVCRLGVPVREGVI